MYMFKHFPEDCILVAKLGPGLLDQESHFLISVPHCLGVVLCPGKGQGTRS